MATHASAEQCIFNAGGFTATVKWYEPKDIKVTKTGQKSAKIDVTNHPVLRYEVMASQYSCTDRSNNLVASISVKDGKAATIGTKIGLSALVAAGAVGVCAGTGGAGCAIAVDLVPEGISAVSQFLPDAKDVFYFDVPRHSRHKHRNVLHGSAFNPSVGWDKVSDLGSFNKGKKL